MYQRYRTFKLPGKATTTVGLLAATGLTFHASNPDFLSFSRDSPNNFPEKVRAGVHGIVRTSRAVSTMVVTVVDYKISLRGVPGNSEEYSRKLSEVHVRSAQRILKLCEANKGFYVKAGQFVAALRQVPKEYSSTLSSLQDQAVPYQFKAIKQALISNLGKDLSELFLSFDEQPIAAASIAQVHRATLKDHQEVAIKVQYPGLIDQMKLDTTTMSFLSESVAWLFTEYRFNWLVTEFAGAISLELDFIQEARNCERTAKNFENNRTVKVPQVFWDMTTSQVLTMEFCAGHKVDDVEFLKEMGINPTKVAKALLEVFAEMIFIHGFLHGDPHPGNILVSPGGQNGFSLVLLDHGIYRQLDEEFRVDYCELWKALIYLDSDKIQQLGEKFGVGMYSKYFPLIFTGRTIDSKSSLGGEMPMEEKTNLRKELKSLKMEDISSFMESLPPDFLAILRTDGLLRSTVSKLGAPQRIRLLAYAKYALRGLSPKSSYNSKLKVMYSRFKANLGYLQLRLALEALELLSGMDKLRQFLLARWKHVLISATHSLVRLRLSILPQALD